MIEVRIHGRGGQGNVVAAYLLATTAINEGWHAQAFPAFGAERRGAPVIAFVRINHEPIKRRCQVAAPDFLIIQDEALMNIPSITDGLKADGRILLNSTRSSALYSKENSISNQLITLPATQLAQQYLGRPVPNTALLAAFLSLTGMLQQYGLIQSLEERFKGEILDKNIALVEAAAQVVTNNLWKEAANA
ncbi:MAG: 2-oxoacid:acceptor oxidoreductase family protein [Gammaproteobacteria bacterium]|nr:2-oxoacid:acceptor oxidoreductase family protein [Gammaproteobacteria bacterium]